jgi:hypothetical protein
LSLLCVFGKPTSIRCHIDINGFNANVWLKAIVIALKTYDGQMTPRWPLGITLNSYLALFTSLAKIFLLLPIIEGLGQLKWLWFENRPRPLADFELFEDASRGSYGSLRLLISRKGGHV